MEQEERRGRGRPKGTTRASGAKVAGGRPKGPGIKFTSAETLAKGQILREHLTMPAEPAHPGRGTRYEAYRKQLAKKLQNPARLGAWWRHEGVQLSEAEIEACWRWLLPQ